MLAAPALCDGKSPEAGYNIYTIFFENKRVLGEYRKFVRKRQEFDRDTDFAKNGEKEYDLPITDLTKHSQGLLCQRLSRVANSLDAKLKESLSIYQRKVDPIYVTPPLQIVTWVEGKKESRYFDSDFTNVADSNALIYGAPETGKTDLLRAIGSAINSNSSRRREGHLAIYYDMADKIGNQFEKSINRALGEALDTQANAAKLSKLTILLDHANKKLPDVLELLPDIITRNPEWKFVVTTANQVAYNGFAASEAGEKWGFYNLAFWGPSRIREFISKFFVENTIDIDAAFAFVSNSLREIDLPAIPLVVILYLNVFRITGNRFSSLSFLDLLKKYEYMRFEETGEGSEVSTYNKERLLATLATECFREKTDILLMSNVQAIINRYFTQKGLPFDMKALLSELAGTGLVEIVPELFAFRYFVFHDYYLARALQVDLVTIDELSSTLQDTLRIANSLALYGGLVRENLALATRLLDQIETNFKPDEHWRLSDLDKHIKGKLMPDFTEEEADQVSTEALERRVDYSQRDEKFHADKERHLLNRREADAKKTSTDLNIHVLSKALKAFYNIFRNLENIDLQDKALLLDRILDFHVHFNVEIIDYFIAKSEGANLSTIFGYCITLSGQAFLSANIGNQTMKEAIDEAINCCNSDFKEMLLLFLYADLRLPGYELKLEQFAKKTSSRAAVELIFFKIYLIMIEYDKVKHPIALINAYRTALRRKTELGDITLAPRVQSRFLEQSVIDVQKRNTIHFYEQQKN